MFNEKLSPHMTDSSLLAVVCDSAEFANIQVREEELKELGVCE